MDTKYNPLAEAAKVAIAELTSDKAQQFYSLKSQRDAQEAIEFSLTILRGLYLIGQFAYDIGYIAGEWHHAAITAIVLANEARPLAFSGDAPVALLPATTGKLRRLPSRVAPVMWIVNPNR